MKQVVGRTCRLVLAIGLIGCLQACSEDEALPTPPRYDLSTPVGVADALRTMLADRDTAAITEVLAPDVAFVVLPFEAEMMGWPAEITARELDRSLRNLLTGAVAPSVTAVTVVNWTPDGPFAAAEPESPFPGSLEANYLVNLAFTRAGDVPYETEATLRLSVAPIVADAAAATYVLVGMQEIANPGGNRSVGRVLAEYLANRPPAIAIAVTPEDGESPHAFAFDVSGTIDPDESAGLEFSWGGDLVGHDWSDWTTTPTTSRTWHQSGTYLAKVRARDRWGLVAADSVECLVSAPTLPFPATADLLMDNFAFIYQAMELALYRDEVLSPDYRFILQDDTVEYFQLPDEIYEYADEVAIAEKMFSGQPNDQGWVLTGIQIPSLQPLGEWQAVAADDPYFRYFPDAQCRLYNVRLYFSVQGDFRYETQGQQMFYVNSEPVPHEGGLAPRYRLLGQLDQTGFLPYSKATEHTSWGDVKATFE